MGVAPMCAHDKSLGLDTKKLVYRLVNHYLEIIVFKFLGLDPPNNPTFYYNH